MEQKTHKAGKLGDLFGGGKAVIYGIALLVGTSVGVINPLSTTHMTANHGEELWIGVISSSYFFFMALGSMVANRTLRGTDMKWVITSGLLLTAFCSTLFPLFTVNAVWLLLMSLMGIGISCNMMGLQTALHSLTGEKSLGMVSGMYSLCFALGLIASSALAPMVYDQVAWLPFAFSSFCLVLASAVIYFKLPGTLIIPRRAGKKVLSKINQPLFGAFVYGFGETIVVSLYPLYLIREHVAVAQTGYGLSIFAVGSILGLLPVTYLADRIGCKRCLILCVAISIFTLLGIVTSSSMPLRLLFSFASGFIIGPLYPLAMALTAQELTPGERSSGNALFTTFYGFGSAAGPFLSSVAMNAWGNQHLFTVCVLLFCLFLAHAAMTRKGSKVRVTKEEIL